MKILSNIAFVILLSISLLGAEPKGPVLPEEHKAYALKIDQAEALAFVIPGSRVDVVLTEKSEDGKVARKSVVAKNLLIVVVDTPNPKGTVVVVSLAVKEDDAKAIANAEKKKGKITLVLRPLETPKDNKKPE